MAPAAELDGARQKLAWGRHHAELFDQEALRLYPEDGDPPLTVEKQFDAHKNRFRYWVETVDNRPGDLAVILGDALHNFRSALDHIAYQLARRQQGRRPRSAVSFPIAPNRERFHSPQVWTLIYEIGPQERRMIENVQPYRQPFTGHTEAHPLRFLSRANNQDKHRLLHVVMLANHEMTVTPTTEDCEVIGFEFAPGAVDRPLKPKMELFRVMVRVTGPNPQITSRIRGGSKLGLDDGAIEGIPLRLTRVGIAVENIIGYFDPVF